MLDHIGLGVADLKRPVAFYRRDNCALAIRAHYHPTCYGAFVLDPDGNTIEAVCHLPE